MAQKTEVTTTTNGRKPSEQALQVVDVTFGAYATVADTVSKAFEDWRHSDSRSKELETLRKRLTSGLEKTEERGGEFRRRLNDQVAEQARKARERVEPVYRDRVEPVVRERVEPVYRDRVEPIVRERVEPVYRDRVEPVVKRVRERI